MTTFCFAILLQFHWNIFHWNENKLYVIYPFFILFGVPWRTDKQNFTTSIESQATAAHHSVVFMYPSYCSYLQFLGCKCIELMVLVLVFRYNWKLYKKRARIKWNENIFWDVLQFLNDILFFTSGSTFLHEMYGRDILFLWWPQLGRKNIFDAFGHQVEG